MKTSSSVRWIKKISAVLLCLGFMGMASAGLGLRHALPAAVAQTAATQPGTVQIPSIGLSDIVIAAR